MYPPVAGADGMVRKVRGATTGWFVKKEGVLREIDRAPARRASSASRLSPRLPRVIGAVVEGLANKEIGKTFGLSEQTLKDHLSKIFDTLGGSNRLDLAWYAVHHQLLAGGDHAVAVSIDGYALETRFPI